LESGEFRNLGKSLRLSFPFSDGQPLNLRRAVSLARGNEYNRGTSSVGGIETSCDFEASGGLPGAKRDTSCFALGSDAGSSMNGLKSSSRDGIMRKPRVPFGSGISTAKKESTLSPSKRKLATKAKIAPPKATYATPRATTISIVAACRPAWPMKPARPTVHMIAG
jgi:hypothetical protein